MHTINGSTIAGLLKRHPLWRQAEPAVIRNLADAARIERTRPGQLFVREGERAEHVHLLSEGVARVFYIQTKAQPEATLTLLRAPAVIGDMACVLQRPYTASAEALVDAVAVVIPAANYFAALGQSPSACMRQYIDLAERYSDTVKSTKVAYSTGLEERVVGVLAAYARTLGIETPTGIRIAGLTQDDLTVQTSSSRRCIVRALAKLYQLGTLKRIGREYEIPSVEALLGAVPAAPDLVHRTRSATWIDDSMRLVQ